jgi:hypothetical protein
MVVGWGWAAARGSSRREIGREVAVWGRGETRRRPMPAAAELGERRASMGWEQNEEWGSRLRIDEDEEESVRLWPLDP